MIKKIFLLFPLIALEFPFFAQDIELPDISTEIGGDSVLVNEEDLPVFKNRVTNINGSGDLVPKLPEIQSPESENLNSSFEEKSEKTLFAEGLVGGGFPGLFKCDFSLFLLFGSEPFKLTFSHDSAEGYVGEPLTSNYFDRKTNLFLQKTFSKNDFSLSLDCEYNSSAEGLQNQFPLFTSLNRDFVELKPKLSYIFNDYFSLNFLLDSYFYTRYSRSSLSTSLEALPSIFYESDYVMINPLLEAKFSFNKFYGILGGQYSFMPNIYGLDNSLCDTVLHRADFSLELGWQSDFTKIYASAAAIVGNFNSGQNVIVPFNAGIEYALPVYFSNRRFYIEAEGGLKSESSTPLLLEEKYKFSLLTFIPEENAFWYAKANLSLPLKSSFTGRAFVEYRQNAFNTGFWEVDYSEESKNYGLYTFSKKELQLLITKFTLSYHYGIFTLSGSWNSNWLDLPALENIQLLSINLALQNQDALWGCELEGMYSFENSLTVPLLNFEGFIAITSSVRIVLSASDIVKLVTGEKRTYGGDFIGRGGSASLFMKFFL